jgi:hypothetical protein
VHGSKSLSSLRAKRRPDGQNPCRRIGAGHVVRDGTFARVPVTEAELAALVGHRFPGGTYTIEHWENALLCDVLCVDPLPGGLVHPTWLCYGPIAGVGLRVADLFALFRAESDEAVRFGESRLELWQPLLEDTTYRLSGEVVGVERKQSRSLGWMDVVDFRIDVHDDGGGELIASNTTTVLFLRGA